MTDQQNKVGRPAISNEEKQLILQKLEPHIKNGISVRKALLEAKIASSTFYKLMDEDMEFMERINTFKQYLSVLTSNALFTHLQQISDKQNGNEEKNMQPQSLAKEDIDFLKWFATNSIHCKEEFGDRKNINLSYDPQEEIHKVMKLIEEHSTKEIKHSEEPQM